MSVLENFKRHLKAHLPCVQSFHPFFNQALASMLLAGGKHFRAQLLLGVVERKKPILLEKAFDAALALEFIHTYSLIHDDLPAMDNADLRRGEMTLHKAFDESTAILVGDALNTEAFLLLANTEFKDDTKIALIKTLAYNAGLNGMVIGQAIDCFFEGKKLDLPQLEFLHTRKTGYLIAASLKMGCEICELSEQETAQIYEFGLKLGLVFQINDDILDEIADEKKSGKPTKADTHKNSFVNLLGLKKAEEAKETLKKECQKKLESIDKDLALMLENLMKEYL